MEWKYSEIRDNLTFCLRSGVPDWVLPGLRQYVQPPVFRRPGQEGKKENEGTLSVQGEKLCRIHGLVIAGDAEVDMGPDGSLQQRSFAHAADGLAQFYRIPGADG